MPQLEELTIPVRIVLGVTGHRKLPENKTSLLAQKVQLALEKIKEAIPPLPNTPIVFTILSPLAEGADRLVAREVLKTPGSQLEAPLPLDKKDYMQDFETSESRAEFEQLLSQARRIYQLPPRDSRTEAYQQVGHYVVDNCDVLIALWNGKPAAGQGGTAEIVEYAKSNKCPLIWINTETGRITKKPFRGLCKEAFLNLDKYNSEKVDIHRLTEQTEKEHNFLRTRAKKARFSLKSLKIPEQLLPHYVKADQLAIRYQRLYISAGTWVYSLAATAVATETFQLLFRPNTPKLVFVEVALLFVIMGIITIGTRQKWLDKWSDYRFLAERFRSAMFQAVAGMDITSFRPLRPLNPTASPNEWISTAFFSIWRQTPPIPGPNPSSLEALKKFLLRAWINGQIEYHEKKREFHHHRHSSLEGVCLVLFGVTFVAASAHAFHLVHSPLLDNLLACIDIIFPAAGGALGAILIHREHFRNHKRSEEMFIRLKEIENKIKHTHDPAKLISLIQQTEELMFHENQTWHVLTRFQKFAPANPHF